MRSVQVWLLRGQSITIIAEEEQTLASPTTKSIKVRGLSRETLSFMHSRMSTTSDFLVLIYCFLVNVLLIRAPTYEDIPLSWGYKYHLARLMLVAKVRSLSQVQGLKGTGPLCQVRNSVLGNVCLVYTREVFRILRTFKKLINLVS